MTMKNNELVDDQAIQTIFAYTQNETTTTHNGFFGWIEFSMFWNVK